MIEARFVYMDPPSRLPMRVSPFKVSYAATLRQLELELRAVRAKQVTIVAGFAQVRGDGWPYSGAKPKHPACALQFQRDGVTLVYNSHSYRTFEDNLRAITLTLEALRAVERYRVANGEQYRGFAQIEAPAAASKEQKLVNLRDNAATEGERAAAQAALDRLRGALLS